MPDPDAIREVVEQWLHRAAADLAAATLLLGDDRIDPELAGYHAQQAAEKALKAILVQRSADVPRTHDLARLRALVLAVTGADAVTHLPATSLLASLTDLGISGRYPGIDADLMHDRDEIAAAIALAAAVVAVAREVTGGDRPEGGRR
jgi:HEPN domain-containing protein